MATVTRIPRSALVLLVALVATLGFASPAHAGADELRDRAHARIAAIMDDAIEDGVYTTDQRDYVDGALLPAYVDPINLPARIENNTVRQFWEVISDGTGLTVGQVKAMLRYGSTLNRISGEDADNIREDLYRWLARPAFQAYLADELTWSQFQDLRNDIQRAVFRVMAQPGGGRDVVLDPRRL